MATFIYAEALDDPKPFYHSHATGIRNLYFTSGMVSRKYKDTKMHIGVSNLNGKIVHNIELQFLDIIAQLYEVSGQIGIAKQDVQHSLIEVRVFLIEVKRYFKPFNAAYGIWMGNKINHPARTTIGVADLPSDVALEMSFTIGVN